MPLSDLQVRVASIVLAVPESDGFALAGGAALIFYEITDRATQDIDCFGPSPEAVDRLHPAAVAALEAAGLSAATQQQGPGFARLRVTSGPDETLLDLGFDPAQRPPFPTPLGAVRALDDLAGDKLLALFSRAEPRDMHGFNHDETTASTATSGDLPAIEFEGAHYAAQQAVPTRVGNQYSPSLQRTQEGSA